MSKNRSVDHGRMMAYIKDNKIKRCELCGSTKGLEVHHILPICAGGSDTEDNYIALCFSCHAKLTPRSQLIRVGMNGGVIEKHIDDCYKSLLAELDDGVNLDANDVLYYVNKMTRNIREYLARCKYGE